MLLPPFDGKEVNQIEIDVSKANIKIVCLMPKTEKRRRQMTTIKIKNQDLIRDAVSESIEFPKYTTQIINLANQNAQV